MKFTKSYAFSVLTGFVATLAFTGSAVAGDRLITKKARSNDVVSSYTLDTVTGTFSRNLERHGARPDRRSGNDQECTLTTRVEDFKVSQHPNDAATAYFIKDGDLHYVQNSQRGTGYYSSNCPPAAQKRLMTSVKINDGKYEYGVISSTQTEYVNYALDIAGTFHAWKNSGRPLQVNGVTDVVNNTCYDQDGKSYSKKILFLQLRSGKVLAMENDGRTTDQGYHRDIQSFKRERNVCQDANGGRRRPQDVYGAVGSDDSRVTSHSARD